MLDGELRDFGDTAFELDTDLSDEDAQELLYELRALDFVAVTCDLMDASLAL